MHFDMCKKSRFTVKNKIFIFCKNQNFTFDVSNLFKYRPNIPPVKFRERSLTVGGRITVQLVSSLNTLVLEEGENMLLWLCSEAVESNLVIAMQ